MSEFKKGQAVKFTNVRQQEKTGKYLGQVTEAVVEMKS